MKFVHILMLLGALFLVLLLSTYMKRQTVENFDAALLDHLQDLDKKYTNKKARRYNNVSDGMNDFLQGYLNEAGDNEEQASGLIKNTLDSPAIVGSTRTESGNLVMGNRSSATHAPKSEIHQKIKFCEALKGDGPDVCQALDKPEYNECGVCLKEGIDSRSRPTVGGLFFSMYDRLSQDELQKNIDPMFRKIKPTVGKCDTRNFVTTGDRCRRRREQLLCEARGGLPRSNPDVANNCAQCVEQGLTFLYRGKKDKEFTAVLHLIAEGDVIFNCRSTNVTDKSPGPGLRYIKFVVPQVKENEPATLTNTGNISRLIVGQWSNAGESRVLPFYESISNKDAVQIGGTVSSTKVTKTISSTDLKHFRMGTVSLMAANKSNNVTLNLNLIGFMGEPDYDEEAQMCPTGGLLGTDTSMRMNKSNPCYTENANAPLSQVCVSNLFLAAGGNVFGQGYPVNQVKTDAILKLMRNSNSIDEVINYFLNKVILATTGKDIDGVDQSDKLDDINAASLYMLGIEVRSPCDLNGVSGPLNNSCLQYLYDNKGLGKREGSTYQDSFGSFTSYCTRKGNASPTKADGSINTAAINAARSKGGVRAVQSYFSQLHKMANTAANASNAGAVMDALGGCYGIVVPQQVAGKTACDLKLIAEYDLTKKSISNTQMLRMSLENTQEFGPMADVDLIFVRNTGSFTFNKNTINVKQTNENNNATITVQCRKARAINFWVRCDQSQPGGPVYLMDLRTDGKTPESYLWKPNDGAFWAKQNMYIDAKKVTTLPWNNLLDSKWHLVSFIFQGTFDGPMSIFTRFSAHQGLSCEFGPIQIFGEIADPANPTKMVTLTEADITAFYNSRPEWANVPTVKGYEYMGCWRDSWDRALPYMLGQVWSREQCADLAMAAGMNTFGVQYYGQCWAGMNPTHNYQRHGAAGACSILGDGWTNQVYLNPSIKPTLTNSMLQNKQSGKCLDIYGGWQHNGADAIVYDCHGGGNQRFDYDQDRKTIRVRHSGRCLTVGSADNAQKITQQDCTGAWNQRWDLKPDGTVVLSGTDKVMNFSNPANLTQAWIWQNYDQMYQKFNTVR
jgi:hypothetical protein